MSESQKGKSVQRNQIGNGKQRNQGHEINENQETVISRQSFGSEEKAGLADKINVNEIFKHLHRQENPQSSDDDNEKGL